jgi:hypothetical protein
MATRAPSPSSLKRCPTAASRARKQAYDRWYKREKGVRADFKGMRISVPDDIVRVETSWPCSHCGAARRCDHRPWA